MFIACLGLVLKKVICSLVRLYILCVKKNPITNFFCKSYFNSHLWMRCIIVIVHCDLSWGWKGSLFGIVVHTVCKEKRRGGVYFENARSCGYTTSIVIMQNYIEAIPNVIEAIQFPGNIAWYVNSCCQICHVFSIFFVRSTNRTLLLPFVYLFIHQIDR